MSIFKRKPRCPACKSTEHTNPHTHADRAFELELRILLLQEELKAAQKKRDELREQSITIDLDELFMKRDAENLLAKRALT